MILVLCLMVIKCLLQNLYKQQHSTCIPLSFPVWLKMVLKHPFTAIVSGPTKAGKTVWVKNLILHSQSMIVPPPEDIYYCYMEWQPLYHDLARHGIHMIEGLPDLAELKADISKPRFLVLDDLMQETKSDKSLVQLFTRGSHHWNLSVLHIVQNLFFEGLRTSRVNAQYLVLMKNPSDQLQASTLAKQLYPGKTKYFMESYKDACSESFGYLFIDLCQDTPENRRLKTNIFPDQMTIVYVPKL